MTNSKDWISQNDAKFDIFQDNLITLVEPNVGAPGTWQIPQADFDLMKAFQLPWELAWADARVKETRTPQQVQTKDDTREIYEQGIRQFTRQWLRFNINISNGEKLALGVTVADGEPTPAPVPATNPLLDIGTKDIGRHYIRYKDEASGKRAKPHGVDYMELRYHIGPNPPAETTGWDHTAVLKRSGLPIEYGTGMSKRTVTYRARWVNTRGITGPWSPEVSAVIT